MRERRLLKNGRCQAVRVMACESWLERARGLLFRRALDRRAILKIGPCSAVHTAGMRESIDVVFTSHDGLVLRCVQGLHPWRIAACRQAHIAWEMRAGLCRALAIQPGDSLADAPQVNADTA